MSIDTKYQASNIEDKWYAYWLKHQLFVSQPNHKKSYTIVIPPPNVTGVLHMGHMLNNTIQDVLVRRARMQGYNACWVPGTDHASIATEAKVVNKLREEGIKKSDLSREQFLAHAWEWTHKHGGIILEQLKKLGASCDWSRTTFTMDPHYYDAVIQVFIDLYNKGYIYRGKRMVNWDPVALTALSDEEVLHKEEASKLYELKYRLADGSHLSVATQRPETLFGDVAICVHPTDERYQHLIGQQAQIPIEGRWIPIIADDYVDKAFGTGCLKVTPAHDKNDYELGKKHQLPIIEILTPAAKLNENTGSYQGMGVFEARKKIVQDLAEQNLLIKEQNYNSNIGRSERTNAVVEPRISWQWFCKMDQISQPALENVMNGNIQFHPEKFKNTYQHWLENCRDWCISRQLWWGHRIPAYFYGDGENDYVVAKTAEEALQLAQEKTGKKLSLNDIQQDEDAMDTWFSSWIWPIEVFKGISAPNNPEINYYYPTKDLVTAPEIMFFWVARMIMAGYEYLNEMPFKNVYYTGIVRDKQGRKMSKSLGNSPDPIALIEKYGADGVRMGMLICSPAGNDILFDESSCEQGRNFCNKIWNAFRLIQGFEVQAIPQPEYAKIAIAAFDNQLQTALKTINQLLDQFRLSEALMAVYKLIWDDFCAWYLEMIKPDYQAPIDPLTQEKNKEFLNQLLQILHPFMPFITEELWQNLANRQAGESISLQDFPQAKASFVDQEFIHFKELITQLRNFRASKNLSPKAKLDLVIDAQEAILQPYKELLQRLGYVNLVEKTAENTHMVNILVGTENYQIIFEAKNEVEDQENLKKELKYLEGFLASINAKLNNEKFVSNAPANVLAAERKKQSDAQTKIASILKQLN